MGGLLEVSFHRAQAGKRSHARRRLWRSLWAGCPGIGWRRLQQLEAAFESLEQAWQSEPEDLFSALAGRLQLSQRERSSLLAYRERHGRTPLPPALQQQQDQHGARPRCLMVGDQAFPPALLALDRPPLRLFWHGRGSLWPHLRRRQAIAVIGTRRPSRHGALMANRIGRCLAEAGWPVVSGLAEGIDAEAHQGCLAANGRPVAVLGTPLERVYPRHHQHLQQEVGRQGLLISEWPNGTPGRAGHFALRNRLLVSLSQAVVLVECPHKSGALLASAMAWQQGLPLWVVPADAARNSAAGSNRWLRQGATPLLEVPDLIHQIGMGPLQASGLPQTTDKPSAETTKERALMEALEHGASLEQLCLQLASPPAAVMEQLLALELNGRIRSEPGLWWRRC